MVKKNVKTNFFKTIKQMKFWKNNIGLLIGVTSLLIFIFILFKSEYYDLLNRKKVCATFINIDRGKSGYYANFIYKVNNKFVKGCRGISYLKIKDESVLKKFDCIEIVYSVSYPTNIRIIDKRVGNESIDWSK